MKWGWLMIACCVVLSGCAGDGGSRPDNGSGRYAMRHDAYPDEPPDVANVPDAVPQVEPRAASGNRSTYRVWGKTYHVLADPSGYEAQGMASWYGKKFQGYDTASGDTYDMYKMSAAHRSLPLPSYARVTNLDNGRTVIVKVNDRGPFHGDRLIDLSYAAAARLDILRNGTGHVRVEAIDPVAWQAAHRQGGASEAAAQPQAQMASQTTAAPAAAVAPANVTVGTAAASPSSSSSGRAAKAASASEDDNIARASAASRQGALYLQVAAMGSASNARRLQVRLQERLDRPVRIASAGRLHRVQVGPVADRLALEALRRELRSAGYAQSFVVNTSD